MANANSHRGEISGGNHEQVNTYRIEDQQHQSSNIQNQGSNEGSGHEAQEEDGRIYEYVVQDVWNLPPGHQIVVDVNKEMQPIGREARVLGCFCGTIARNGKLCSLSYSRWDHLKKGGNRNNEAMILKEVKKPGGKESLMNAKVTPISTTGTKRHARVREELNQIKSIVAEQGDKEMNLDDDLVLKVLGKDQYGRVRGLGLGAKPSNFAEISAPPYCTSLNLSSKDERAVFYHLRQLKGWTQRLNKRVKRQDTTIKKLKSKLQSQVGSDFDDSDSDNSDSGSSDFDEDDDFNIHGVDK
ncbi:hypothetical protein RDABS01_030389, partial [Bienertia sinuspersici]